MEINKSGRSKTSAIHMGPLLGCSRCVPYFHTLHFSLGCPLKPLLLFLTKTLFFGPYFNFHHAYFNFFN